jgi:hypothetical protein
MDDQVCLPQLTGIYRARRYAAAMKSKPPMKSIRNVYQNTLISVTAKPENWELSSAIVSLRRSMKLVSDAASLEG